MRGIDLYRTFNVRPLDEATVKRAIAELAQSAGLLYAEPGFSEEVQRLIQQYRSKELALQMKPLLDPEKAQVSEITENPDGLEPGMLRSKLKEIPGMQGQNDARVVEKIWSLVGAGVIEISSECTLVQGRSFA